MTDSAPRPHSSPPAPIPLPVARRGSAVEAAGDPALPARREIGFDLSLGSAEAGARPRGVPVLGGLATIFGVAALFKAPLVLAPLGFLFAIAALFRGQAGWSAIGGIAGAVALAISPMFWGLVGLAWLARWLLG